jgi:hypothetical protein
VKRCEGCRCGASLFFSRGGEFGFVEGVELNGINDADDGGVDGAVFALGGQAGGTAGDDENRFAEAGVNRVDSDEVTGFVAAFGIDGLDDEELFAFEARVLTSGNDGADDASEKHEIEFVP